MSALTYRLTLLDPVLVKRVNSGDPNSGVGLDFVPGSSLRGALVGRYAGAKDAANADFRRLFLDGSVRYLNAYPADSRDQRMLPTPLSWRFVKDSHGEIRDWAIEGLTDEEAKEQWIPVTKPFCTVWRNEEGKVRVELWQREAQVNIHNARLDRQKTTAEGATVFRYEALPAGMALRGVILGEAGDLATILNLLPTGATLLLGASQRASYGRVQVVEAKIVPQWAEVAPVGDDADASPGLVRVTLLSDTIVRDPASGAYVASLDPVVGATHTDAFARSLVVSGFNRKWNLPLPQTPALEAGSVFIYDRTDLVLQRLAKLVEDGVGERRAEGFGRIALDWHQAASLERHDPAEEKPDPASLSADESKAIAARMTERMLRAALDQAVAPAAQRLRIESAPQKSQLSAVRVVAREALAADNLQLLVDHINGMKRAARDQFDRARINSGPLSVWLLALAQNPTTVWDHVKPDSMPTIGGVKAEKTDAMAREYALRLIDRLMYDALKRREHERTPLAQQPRD